MRIQRPRQTRKPQKPQKPSFFSYFIVGLIGALVGGLLFSAIYQLYELPPQMAEELKEEAPEEDSTTPLEHQRTAIIDAVEKVTPSVVGISNSLIISRGGRQVVLEQSTGSGVILNSRGYIVTNHHVVEGAERLDVIFRDGTIAEAELMGEDPLTDLAVLKISMGDARITPAVFTDSEEVRPGETAVAIGNPLGLIFQHTVTVGVVSALDRQVLIPGSQYRYTYIQTDAAINEGNSGGPLINLAGEVMGINSAKIKDTGVEGIGFAIPGNTVQRVIEDLIQHGNVRRPLLGVIIQDLAEVTGNSTDRGVYINEVSEGSPAGEAGVLQGDVIIGIDDYDIDFTAKLFDRLLEYNPGDTINLIVNREGDKVDFNIELAEMAP